MFKVIRSNILEIEIWQIFDLYMQLQWKLAPENAVLITDLLLSPSVHHPIQKMPVDIPGALSFPKFQTVTLSIVGLPFVFSSIVNNS